MSVDNVASYTGDPDEEREFYGILAASQALSADERRCDSADASRIPELASYIDLFRTAQFNQMLRVGKVLFITAICLSSAYVTFSDSNLDVLGDIGHEKTDEQVLAEVQQKTLDELKATGTPPEELFRSQYMSSPVTTRGRSGSNGFLAYVMRGDNGYQEATAVPFDDCLAIDQYVDDATEFTVTREEDGGSRIFLAVDPADDAVLHFEYAGDSSSPSGFTLVPLDKATSNEMGFRGCEGFVNPVTGNINPASDHSVRYFNTND